MTFLKYGKHFSNNSSLLGISFGFNNPFDLANFNFTYLDGEEEIEYKRIRTNEAEGSIAVYGAVLDHFSRYGWTRTTTVK